MGSVMLMLNYVYFIIYLIISFAIAWRLREKYPLFKKIWGWLILLNGFMVAAFIHNLISGIGYFFGANIEEPFFFIIALLSLGASFFMFWLWLIDKIRNKIPKDK